MKRKFLRILFCLILLLGLTGFDEQDLTEDDMVVIEKTTTNMIQKTSPIFAVKPLISKEI